MGTAETPTISPYALPGMPEDVIGIFSEIDPVTKVERTVYSVHKKNFNDLRIRTRKKGILRARNHAIYLLYLYTELSLESICAIFRPAVTDYSSVIHARDTIIQALNNKKIDKHNYMLGGVSTMLDYMKPSEITRIRIDGIWSLKSKY